ncbi:hypothetical protein ACIQUP_04090 [Streptomyces nigra]|uniref:hypothetical protein n=1 Tax=Streptomyces nigra TaxID=1827580 RepID=UPI0037FB4541
MTDDRPERVNWEKRYPLVLLIECLTGLAAMSGGTSTLAHYSAPKVAGIWPFLLGASLIYTLIE